MFHCSVKSDSFAAPCTVGSSVMGFPRQEYWTGLPFLSPKDMPDPGIEPASAVSPALQVDSLLAEPSEKPLSVSNETHKCI